jgi:hypothetical protein
MLLLCFDGIKPFYIEYKYSILEYVNTKCVTLTALRRTKHTYSWSEEAHPF